MTSSWEYYGEPEPFEIAAAKTRFFQIGALALERFASLPAYDSHLQIIPLDPDHGKRPAKGFMPSQHAVPIKNREALALLAAAHPDANVGISSRRAVGAIIVIDCDEAGVVERIERETARRLPHTYITLTRPQSKPHKRHIYFQSTEYSVARIRKQVTNVTRICGYDLKGCGGFGYVATEGCDRDGEPIVALHDVPVAPIPDWLVDWLVADIAEARKQKRKKKQQPAGSETTLPARPETPTSRPRSFAVVRDDRHWTIKSRIRTWKNTGMSDEQIMPVLLDHIRQYVEDGERLVADTAYVVKLRATVRKVPTLGDVSYRILTHRRRSRRQRRSTVPLSTVRERFLSCPMVISPGDARAFFSVSNRADHERLMREFRRHGYIYVGSQGSHSGVWSRPALLVGLSPSPTTSTDKKTPSSTRKEQERVTRNGAGRPHLRKMCMSAESTQDQEAGDVRSHTHFDDRDAGKDGGDCAENSRRPEAA